VHQGQRVVSLADDVLEKLEHYAGTASSRSAYIERVLRRHFRRRARLEVNEQDRRKIDAAAERLNREAADVLDYQADWSEDQAVRRGEWYRVRKRDGDAKRARTFGGREPTGCHLRACIN
jgi:predicted Rossmann fold nucleotide-binding protein DprA/Smf involved in DNA uptake